MDSDWDRFISGPEALRCIQAYRRENGEWKIILRHTDEFPRKDEQQR